MEPTNLIPKFTPAPIEIDDDLRKLFQETSERHDVPFGSLSVDAFHEDALIREALAQYFTPSYFEKTTKYDENDKEIGEESKDTVLCEMLSNVFPQGLQKSRSRWRDDVLKYNFPIRVKVIIDYPLQEVWAADVTIPADRFGSLFAIAYDMYKHIYDLDDSEWQGEGEDDAPRLSPKMMNRAAGKHVWGHDMSDLVFEYLTFTPNPDWPTVGKKKMKFIEIKDLDEMAEVIKDPKKRKELEDKQVPEINPSPAPLDFKIHSEEPPFLGWVTFSIGS